MGRVKDTKSTNIKKRPGPLAFEDDQKASQPEEETDLSDDIESDEDETESGEEGEHGGESGGGSGGGVYFEEAQRDRDFDPTELQGLSLPIFRNALKKGLKLASRVTKQWEPYLRNFLPEIELRARVVEVAFSEKGHPTLLLDKGEIVQYQHSRGKLDRVRVSPDLDAERAVKYAMAGFLAAGESIDPKDVKFGRSPEFEARMKPIWVREWHKIQQQQHDNDLHIGMPRRDASFRQSIESQPAKKPLFALKWSGGQQRQGEKVRIDLPRAGISRPRDPQL